MKLFWRNINFLDLVEVARLSGISKGQIEGFNKQYLNNKVKRWYNQASDDAKHIFSTARLTDPDIPWIRDKYKEECDKFGPYREQESFDRYAERKLCVRELCKLIGIPEKWKDFSGGPGEPLCWYAISKVWNPYFIQICPKVGKYELDFNLVDMFGNFILFVDVQSKWHKNRVEKDNRKRIYYNEEMKILFITLSKQPH